MIKTIFLSDMRQSFPRRSHLKSTPEIHTGQKLKCQICGKQFNQFGNLSQLSPEISLGEKPFKCQTCKNSHTEKWVKSTPEYTNKEVPNKTLLASLCVNILKGQDCCITSSLLHVSSSIYCFVLLLSYLLII